MILTIELWIMHQFILMTILVLELCIAGKYLSSLPLNGGFYLATRFSRSQGRWSDRPVGARQNFPTKGRGRLSRAWSFSNFPK